MTPSRERAVLAWGGRLRDLPWRRGATRAILVSEVMAQQTGVDRVVPYYQRFLDRFPPAACAAGAARRGAAAGAGLGYNRRAVNLHGCARRWSTTTAGLCRRTWPPCGRCPASVPHGRSAGVRVRARHRGGRHQRRAGAGPVGGAPARCRRAQAQADALCRPAGRGRGTRSLNGGTVCLRRRPRCASCPVRQSCAWAAARLAVRIRRMDRRGSAGQPRFEGSDRQGRGRLVEALSWSVALADLPAVMGWPDDQPRRGRSPSACSTTAWRVREVRSCASPDESDRRGARPGWAGRSVDPTQWLTVAADQGGYGIRRSLPRPAERASLPRATSPCGGFRPRPELADQPLTTSGRSRCRKWPRRPRSRPATRVGSARPPPARPARRPCTRRSGRAGRVGTGAALPRRPGVPGPRDRVQPDAAERGLVVADGGLGGWPLGVLDVRQVGAGVVAGRPVRPEALDERQVVHGHRQLGQGVEEEHVPRPPQLVVREEAAGDGGRGRHGQRHRPAPGVVVDRRVRRERTPVVADENGVLAPPSASCSAQASRPSTADW